MSLPLRGALWLSFAAVVVAVYLGLQHPLQNIFTSNPHNQSQIFCYSKGITAKASSKTTTTCFTVKDGLFVDVFTPKSELPGEVRLGHAIPGLWDGVSIKPLTMA